MHAVTRFRRPVSMKISVEDSHYTMQNRDISRRVNSTLGSSDNSIAE